MPILLNKSSEIEDVRKMPNSEIEKYIQLTYKRESNKQLLRERLIEGRTYREIIERHYFSPVEDWMGEEGKRVVRAWTNEIQRMETKFYRVIRKNRRAKMDDLISRQAAIDALERKKDKNAKGDIGGFYNKIIQNDIDALMQLPSAQPDPRWIPVTERLPEEEKDVLVARHFMSDKQLKKNAITESFYVEVASYMDDEWTSYSDEYKIKRHLHKVIAWMPLPWPYLEEGEANDKG